MEHFSSYLELMVAFNFAYVLAQDFFKDLLVRAVGISKKIETDSESISSFSIRSKQVIEDAPLVKDFTEALRKKAIGQWDSIILELKVLKSTFEAELKDLAGPVGFSELCFISGLFLISILVLSGFKSLGYLSYHHCGSTVNCLMIFYLISYLILIIFNSVEKLAKKIKYDIYGNAFSLVLFFLSICASFLLCLNSRCDNPCPALDITSILSFYLIVILPWLHFAFYLLLAICRSKKSLGEIRNQLEKIDERKTHTHNENPYMLGYRQQEDANGKKEKTLGNFNPTVAIHNTKIESKENKEKMSLDELIMMFKDGLLDESEFLDQKSKL